MIYNRSYSKNKLDLNRCEKIYNAIGLVSAVLGAASLFGGLYLGLLGADKEQTATFFFSGILSAVHFVFEYLACYCKKTFYAVIATIIIVTTVTILPSTIISPFSGLSVIELVLLTLANKKYHYLEECEGFPEFNERVDVQNEAFNSQRYAYAEEYERLKEKRSSRSTDYMDDI